jgi:hypothetical protein
MLYMRNRHLTYQALFLIFMAILGLQACQTQPAHQSYPWHNRGFTTDIISTSSFQLFTAHHITQPHKDITVYIEGDGQSWISRHRLSADPTPLSSLVRDLTLHDKTENVIYMARPCQFVSTLQPSCNPFYWDEKRFSDVVVNAMDDALTQIKQRYKNNKFRLVGYSGGGAIALLLAQQRSDISRITTIAGHLDSDAVTALHKTSPLTGSLNPADKATSIAHITQYHYVGSKDKIIPPSIAQNYVRNLPENHKAQIIIVPNATHDKGWDGVMEKKK